MSREVAKGVVFSHICLHIFSMGCKEGQRSAKRGKTECKQDISHAQGRREIEVVVTAGTRGHGQAGAGGAPHKS